MPKSNYKWISLWNAFFMLNTNITNKLCSKIIPSFALILKLYQIKYIFELIIDNSVLLPKIECKIMY